MPTPQIILAVVFILYMLVRALRGRTGATWLHLLLAILVIAPLTISIVSGSQQDSPSSATMMAAITAVAFIVTGAVLFFIERRGTRPGWNQSQGILSLVLGGLIIVSVLVSPIVSQLALSPAFETVVTAQEEPVDMAVVPTPSSTVAAEAQSEAVAFVPVNTLMPTVAPIHVAVVSADVVELLPTRFVYTAPTPTEIAEEVAASNAACDARVPVPLNVRSGPSVETLVIVSMPAYTSVNVHNRNADGTWLYIEYENQFGWVSADFVNLSDDCLELPVYEGS